MQLLSYKVEENEEGFVIGTKWTLATWERLLSVLGIGVAVWIFLLSFHVQPQLRYPAALFAAIFQAFRCLGMYETCTTITKFEARPTGKFPHSYRPASFVPLANIVYLTYRKEEPQGEDNPLPSGLWAELARGSTCLVPQLTKDETDALIALIENRFHNVIGSGIPTGHSDGNLIILGLTR